VSLRDIRHAIKKAMDDIPAVGLVNDFEPWARREEDFRRYFWSPELEFILGWTITREATEETDDSHDPANFSTHVMVIRGYRALADGASTEKQFQDLIEIVRVRLRAEQVSVDDRGNVCGGLNGTCLRVAPPQVRIVEVRTFGDFLVHYCELLLRCTEELPIEPV
jgi:hypothetical protein